MNHSLREVELKDQIIFAVTTSQLLAFDVTDSTRLRLAGFIPIPAYLRAIDVKMDKIYLTGYKQGVYVIRYDIVSTDVQLETVRPERFSLAQNYPNPFNPSTTITYEIPATNRVLLTVMDVLGRKVQTLVDEMKTYGVHQARFNASELSSGVYFYRLQFGGYRATKKMVFSK